MTYEKKGVRRCLDNQLISYPHTRIHHLTVAYARSQLISKSEAVEIALKEFFSKMNEAQKNNLMKFYDSMTPEERKYPHKNVD